MTSLPPNGGANGRWPGLHIIFAGMEIALVSLIVHYLRRARNIDEVATRGNRSNTHSLRRVLATIDCANFLDCLIFVVTARRHISFVLCEDHDQRRCNFVYDVVTAVWQAK
jgi:hypothetical protein